MYRQLIAVSAAAMLALMSTPASAQSDHMNMHGMDRSTSSKHSSTKAAVEEHEGSGKVTRIDGKSITIAHGPIAAVGWPAMTMSFALTTPQVATGIAVGDTVRFRFTQHGKQSVVTHLTKGK